MKLLKMLGDVYVLGTVRKRPNPNCDACAANQTTRQTAGQPDVRAFLKRPGNVRPELLEWEAKSPGGYQSPAQQRYMAQARSADVWYVCGPFSVLEDALRVRGYIR